MNVHKIIWTVVTDCSEFFLSATIKALNVITMKPNIDTLDTITGVKIRTRIAFTTGYSLGAITKAVEVATMKT